MLSPAAWQGSGTGQLALYAVATALVASFACVWQAAMFAIAYNDERLGAEDLEIDALAALLGGGAQIGLDTGAEALSESGRAPALPPPPPPPPVRTTEEVIAALKSDDAERRKALGSDVPQLGEALWGAKVARLFRQFAKADPSKYELAMLPAIAAQLELYGCGDALSDARQTGDLGATEFAKYPLHDTPVGHRA